MNMGPTIIWQRLNDRPFLEIPSEQTGIVPGSKSLENENQTIREQNFPENRYV